MVEDAADRELVRDEGDDYVRQDDRAVPLDLERNLIFPGFTVPTDARVY